MNNLKSIQERANNPKFVGWNSEFKKAESALSAVAVALDIDPSRITREYTSTYSVDGLWFDVNNQTGKNGVEFQVVIAE